MTCTNLIQPCPAHGYREEEILKEITRDTPGRPIDERKLAKFLATLTPSPDTEKKWDENAKMVEHNLKYISDNDTPQPVEEKA